MHARTTPTDTLSAESSIQDAIAAVARRDPARVAVEFGGRSLSYGELVERAQAFAVELQALGAGPETIVALCAERSLELAVGLLGILYAGAAYLPIDPAYPAERVAHMVSDSGARIVATLARHRSRFDSSGASVVTIDGARSRSDRERTVHAQNGESLAYVIYTSGSTGTPKGVMCVQRGLTNHARAMVRIYGLTPADRVLQFTSISFDVAAEEIFPTWLAGGTVVLRPDEIAGNFAHFLRFLDEQKITVVNLPAAYWQEWTADLVRTHSKLPKSLRLVIAGSEKVLPAHLATWKRVFGDSVRWINGYGPTETTITATLFEPRDGDFDPHGACVPIGQAIDNVTTYVLDAERRPVARGEIGELYIGGAGVARGYLNRPELTAERFLPDPFSGAVGARMYRTGDMARELDSGAIDFLGRDDEQVKLRGFRIELGEIEAALATQPGVGTAVVVAREDMPGVKRLVAYVVAQGEARDLVASLRERLKARLPDYMLPSEYVLIAELPRLPNGKVDKRSLPAPVRTRGVPREGYVAPSTPTEKRLVAIFEKLLGADPIGTNESFFELGGHSLLGTQLVSHVREEFGVELPLGAVFEDPTPARLSKKIEGADPRSRALPYPPMQRADRSQPIPLSLSQEPVWFLLQLEPGLLAYNTQFSIRFRGRFDPEAMRRALNEVVRRHEIFRTTFEELDGRPVQVIHEPPVVEVPILDLTDVPEDDRDQRADEIANECVLQRFYVTELPLLQWTLLKIREDDWELVQDEHHFVHDGWSIALLLGEIRALYHAFSEGRASPLPALQWQFADYAVWQRQVVAGERLERLSAFWKQKLAGAPPLLELPTDRPRPPMQTFNGASQVLPIPPELYDELRALARREGFTLFQLMLSAFKVLLHRYTGQDDIVLATAAANRRTREVETIIGMMVNAVLLRSDASGNPTFREFATRVRRGALESFEHQDMPFEKVVEAVQPARDFSHNPLFQVLFSFHDSPVPDLELPGLVGKMVYRYNGSAKFDMNLVVIPRGEQRIGRDAKSEDEHVILEWEYNTDLFDHERVTRMLGHYRTLLVELGQRFDQPIGELPLLTAPERKQLLGDWNDTRREFPAASLLHELFEQQAARTPDAAALSFGERTLTYRELNAKADLLARHLAARGVGPDVVVGVCVERSPEMVIALLGVMKAGGAYLPLDPAFPRDRLAYIVGDALGGQKVALLVTQQSLLEVLPTGAAECVLLDAGWEARVATPSIDIPRRTTSEHLAYAIYTSGSTGKPKGVEVPHRAVVNFMTCMRGELGLESADALLAVTTLSFDIAGLELFLPLSIGARVAIATHDEATDGRVLGELLASTRATAMQATPATWRMLLASGWSGNSRLKALCGGEALPRELAQELRPKVAALFNLYGPTETTIWSAVSRIEENDALITIGHPIANTSLHVLDPRGGLCPIGIPGELSIGGAGLARGYHNRPELTAEKFVRDPFSTQVGARLYRTGDLVRRLADGRIEFLGRLDHQIKLRGFRIELGEIENALATHPAVQKALVLVREFGPDDQRLVAWLVPNAGAAPSSSELRAHLALSLPEYMLPAAFVVLREWPLTPNGKIDRKALPAPEGLSSDRDYVAPSSANEIAIAAVWQETLSLARVGLRDNFFDLGGHSLLAMRVIARLERDLEVRIHPRDMMLQNLGQLAALCTERKAAAASAPAGATADGGTNLGSKLFQSIKGIVRKKQDGRG